MSAESLQKVYDVARSFVADVEKLPQLIEAIKEHRTAEVTETSATAAADPTAGETVQVSA